MDNSILKDNLDFYEKIANVTRINDQITNELNGILEYLYSLTTFGMCLSDFDQRDETVVFRVGVKQIVIEDYSNVIFKLTYLKELIHNSAKKNEGLRIVYNYSEYIDSNISNLYEDLYDYIGSRKEYIDDSVETIAYLKQYIYCIQDRLNNIQKLLDELR